MRGRGKKIIVGSMRSVHLNFKVAVVEKRLKVGDKQTAEL